MLEKKKDVRGTFISLVAVVLFLGLVMVLDQVIKPSNKMYMLLTVLQKGSVYALAAVSMNLLNGFTGLFSLGHAGFMLIGAYTYAIFSIPAASRDTVYQYYDAAVRISFPEVLGNAMGGFGTVLGVIICVVLAGLMASLFAYLIGLPVLRLKSDYLAIATLGFAEIVRGLVQLSQFGPLPALIAGVILAGILAATMSTADSQLLELLGLEPHKAVILSVVREDLVEEIMNCLEDKFCTVRGGKGICFAIPLSSVIGVNLYQFLSDNRMGREG